MILMLVRFCNNCWLASTKCQVLSHCWKISHRQWRRWYNKNVAVSWGLCWVWLVWYSKDIANNEERRTEDRRKEGGELMIGIGELANEREYFISDVVKVKILNSKPGLLRPRPMSRPMPMSRLDMTHKFEISQYFTSYLDSMIVDMCHHFTIWFVIMD